MKAVLGAIALEAAYQLTLARTHVRWTRKRFFREGQKIVAAMK